MSLSGVFFSVAFRRFSATALILAALLALPGCWVYSVEPLYEAKLSRPDPDLVFDSAITGPWLRMDKDNDCLWTLAITAEQQVYELTMAPASNCKDQKAAKYEGHLVKLGNHRFLDVGPNSGEVCDLCLPLHSFFLISQENDTLALMPVSDDWLRTAIAQQKVTLAHLAIDDRPSEVSSDLTLTASSRDLKAFALKYADDKAAFTPAADLVFKRK